MIKFTCQYCGQEAESRTHRTTWCSNPECQKKHRAEVYQRSKPLVVCLNCGKEFKRARHSTLCPDCTKLLRSPIYKTYVQKVICKHCGKTVAQVQKNITRKPIFQRAIGVCEDCKQLNRQKASERMRLHNPAIPDRTPEEIAAIDAQKEAWKNSREDRQKQLRQKNSERMKLNNPMKQPEIVEKMRETQAHNRLNKPHHFKKLSLKEVIRTYLYQWKDQELVRAGYKCERCGAEGVPLQVHHCQKKYKDIFAECCRELGIKYHSLELRTPEFQSLVKAVQEYHLSHEGLGQVLCNNCHLEVDDHYRRYKNQENLNENNSDNK